MDNNKSPGEDGLQKKFNVTFWDQLKDPLLEVFKDGFTKGILPPSMPRDSISLQPIVSTVVQTRPAV